MWQERPAVLAAILTVAALPEEERTASFVLLQMGTQRPGNLGLAPGRLSQSPRLLLWSACQSPDCYGGPGPATLPSVPGDLRDQHTDCPPVLVTVLSPSHHPHFCACVLLSMLPSLLPPCLLGDKAGRWSQRHAWDCSQKCFVQNSKGLSPRMWTFLPGELQPLN